MMSYQAGAVHAIVRDNTDVTRHNTGNVTTNNTLPNTPFII